MGLEKAFGEFNVCLQRLLERLDELRLTVVEDRPEHNDAAVVDTFEDAVFDLLGWMNEMLQSARAAQQFVQSPAELDRARRALASCQHRFQTIEGLFSEKLMSYDRLNDLMSLVAERRGEWPSWATSVRKGIELCREPLEEARSKLAECWQEIAERAGMTSVSVHNTSVGQQIVPRSPAREPAREESA